MTLQTTRSSVSVLAVAIVLAAVAQGSCAAVANSDLNKAVDAGDITAVLRELKAKPNLEPACRPNETCKPLARAARMRHVAIVKALIEAGADPNGRNAYGDTAFVTADWSVNDNAPQKHRDEVVEIRRHLLENGLNPNQSNDFGVTPFTLLAGLGEVELMEIALLKGANINHRSKESGYTALITAAQFNRPKVVAWLLARGADASLRSNEGFTAHDVAKIKKHAEVESQLASRH